MFFIQENTNWEVKTCSSDYLDFSRSLLRFFVMISYLWRTYFTSDRTAARPILIQDPEKINAGDGSDQISTAAKAKRPILLDELEDDEDCTVNLEIRETQTMDADDSMLLVRKELKKQPEEMVRLPSRVLSIIDAFAAWAENNSEAFDALSGPPKQLPCDSFTLFPKLPSELRIMVWRYTFPKPRIILLDHVRNKDSRLEIQHALGIENFRMFPTTLQVSKESRRETLMMYHLVNPHWPWLTHQILCFDPVRDFVSISFVSLQAVGHSLREHILKIDPKRAYLKSITSFNIWDGCWFDHTMVDISKEEPHLPHDTSLNCCSLRLLLLFPNMKELRIHFRENHYSWNPRLRDNSMEECKVVFTSYLEHHADIFEGNVPRVVVQGMEKTKGTF